MHHRPPINGKAGRSSSRSLLGLALSVAGAIFAGCDSSEVLEPTSSSGERPNLLLITLDTTRTDRLGCYGHEAARTPAIDALAARGTLFENAYSPAPMTLPAHATLLTGLLPPQHGARVNGEHRLAEGIPTLAEELSLAGYRTGAFIAAFVLDAKFGLARGFDHYDDELDGAYEQEVPSALARYRPGDRVVDSALAWLEQGDGDEPFFAWVHLYDAHYPWHPHGDQAEGSYDGEIAFLDRQVHRLIQHLADRKLEDHTYVIAVADHGEGLNDHGELEHGYLLNEEVLHVPWIVTGPGVKAGHRVPSLVSLEDFHPTAHELLGLSSSKNVPGRSLVPALRDEPIESGYSYAETDLPWTAYRWAPQRSLTTEEWKYIRTPQPELYDRRQDRQELVNLVEVKPNVGEELESRLGAIEEMLGEREVERPSLTPEERAQLSALGYAGGSSPSSVPLDGSVADVKERLPAKRLASRFQEALAQGMPPEEVLPLAQELVRLSPETPSFHGHLGSALVRTGEIEAGLAELRLTIQLDPKNASAHYDLGDTLVLQGRAVEARPHLETALELEPRMAAAHVGMGNVLRAEGRPDLAAGRYAEALRLRPQYPEAQYNLALTFLDRGNLELAAAHFRKAVALRPDWARAHVSLANLYASWGKAPKAITHYRAALELRPKDADLHNDLGVVLQAVDRPDEAREQYEEALRIAPDYFRPHINLGNLALAEGDDAAALGSFERALRIAPGEAEPTSRLARFLATCPDEAHRDAERAIALAERASDLTGRSNPRVLDTLAAAYAAAGRFPDAISTAHRAQSLAKAAGLSALAAAIEKRVAAYALGEAHVEPRPAER